MLIDTHCHLFMEPLLSELEEVLLRAKSAGIEKIIVPAINEESAEQARQISSRFSEVYFAVGIHPMEVSASDTPSRAEELIQKYAGEEKLVAIGEIGLDFRHRRSFISSVTAKSIEEAQIELFTRQVLIAEKLNLPVIIHNRDAGRQILEILEQHPRMKGVFHCYDGAKRTLKFCLQHNFYLSFTGNLTYPGSFWLANALRKVPLEKLLLETDSPFMAPVPFQKGTCEPAHLVQTLAFISELLEKSTESIKIITTANAYKLFGLGSCHSPKKEFPFK